MYDEDERIAPRAATTFVQREVDNVFMLSGGKAVVFHLESPLLYSVCLGVLHLCCFLASIVCPSCSPTVTVCRIEGALQGVP